MKTITESARQVPVIDEVDVLVVGSGPGGLSAALAAARAGVRTMLVERSGCIGGTCSTITDAGDVGRVQVELLRQGVRLH